MKIGLIVAMEVEAIFDYYKDIKTLPSPEGFKVYYTKKENSEIYIIHTGMGEVYAAAGVQYLISTYGIEAVVNFGVVGGLTEEMKKHSLCVVRRVVHFRYDCSEFLDLKIGQVEGKDSVFLPTDENLFKKALEICPTLTPATCCSSDKFIGKESDKAQMHRDFEGDICDMESAGIVLTCQVNGIPCLLLKAVSDSLSGGAKEFFTELKKASDICLAVTDKIIESMK